jgi:phenylacetate-CoA ligase
MHGDLLALKDRYLAELIVPDGEVPALDGELAELVLTNLGRTGSPLFRYRTGDIVKGRRTSRGIVLEAGILARADDMLHVRGNNIYPSAIEAVVRRFNEVAEFRILVDRSGPLADLAVEIEPTGESVSRELAENVARALRDELLFRVPVNPVACGSLPRYEMKAKRVVETRSITKTNQ